MPLDQIEPDDAPGDDGFRAMFDATYRPLVAYARRRVTDPTEADDVVAEVFAIAWRRHHELRPGAQPLPWLYGMAANVIRNQRRSQARRLRLVDRLEHQPQQHRPVADPAERPGADLRVALAELSFDDQEVLRLAAWEGLSHAEIATILGVSNNAVAIRLHRARQRLRTQLAADDKNSPAQQEEQSDDR